LASSSQSLDSVKTIDLRSDWKVFEDQSLVPYSQGEHSKGSVIYLEVDPGRYQQNSNLRIRSSKPLSVYLNYKLLGFNSTRVEVNMDSLLRYVPTPWLIGLYRQDGFSWLSTEVISVVRDHSNSAIVLRPNNYYLDFAIIATVTLLTLFIILLQTNPRLTFDYFNFVRLFSIQEREDSLLNSRISASVNILYYAFSSITIGFALLTIFHFGADNISLAKSFAIDSLGSAFWQWAKLSFYVFATLIIRLVILTVIGSLFDFRDVLSLQFYNSVRLGFFASTVSFLLCLCFFIFGIQSPGPYSSLITGFVLLLVIWVFLVGLKLLRRTSFRFFHLFSYLCASELIPIVILVKVLNS
jgi:hypothetical protein